MQAPELSAPRSPAVPPALAARLSRRLRARSGLLLGLDFDGTLAPIAPDPDAPIIDPTVARQLEHLATHESVSVAVVSGRQVDDLAARVGLAGVIYAGNHGLEVRRDGGTEVQHTARPHRPAIAQVSRAIADRLAALPGLAIEDKRVTATVHYRTVPEECVPEVIRAVDALVANARAPLTVTHGKEILEIRPAVNWDKGRLVISLQRDLPADWMTLYVGDDTTDEDAFAAIEPEGLGVRVGEDGGPTAASAVLPDQSSVAALLALVRRELDR